METPCPLYYTPADLLAAFSRGTDADADTALSSGPQARPNRPAGSTSPFDRLLGSLTTALARGRDAVQASSVLPARLLERRLLSGPTEPRLIEQPRPPSPLPQPAVAVTGGLSSHFAL